MQIHDNITAQVLANNADKPHADKLRAAWHLGLFRVVRSVDLHSTVADQLGDSYKPECCPEIPPLELTRQKRTEVNRIRRLGIYGVIAQARGMACHDWQDLPDCAIWGFTGMDFVGSGYESDYCSAALEFLDSQVDVHQIQLDCTQLSAGA